MESSQPMEGKRVSKIIIRPYDWHSNKNPHRVYRAAKKKVISSAQGGRMVSQEESENLEFESVFSGYWREECYKKKVEKSRKKSNKCSEKMAALFLVPLSSWQSTVAAPQASQHSPLAISTTNSEIFHFKSRSTRVDYLHFQSAWKINSLDKRVKTKSIKDGQYKKQ